MHGKKILAHRSITIASDEPICIATNLGLSLEQFDPLPTMVDIYRSLRTLRTLPQDHLFIESAKIQLPDFRWAPKTFLGQAPTSFLSDEEPALRTKNGLIVYNDCIISRGKFDFYRNPNTLPELYFVRHAGKMVFVFMERSMNPPPQRFQNFLQSF